MSTTKIRQKFHPLNFCWSLRVIFVLFFRQPSNHHEIRRRKIDSKIHHPQFLAPFFAASIFQSIFRRLNFSPDRFFAGSDFSPAPIFRRLDFSPARFFAGSDFSPARIFRRLRFFADSDFSPVRIFRRFEFFAGSIFFAGLDFSPARICQPVENIAVRWPCSKQLCHWFSCSQAL